MKVNFKTLTPALTPLAFSRFMMGFLLALISSLSFAQTIVVTGSRVIDKPTKFENVTLDLSKGNFIIKQNGVLEIDNSVVNVSISADNNFFSSLNNGHLVLKNNVFNVKASGIAPNATAPAAYQLIQVNQGTLNLTSNQFTIDTAYTVGFLTTNPSFTTDGFKINQNSFRNFHGGLYLYNSNDADVNDNTFDNVSFANVLNVGNMGNYQRNIFTFPGNLNSGDAFDIVNSNGVTVQDNIIASSANYGIYVMGCQDLFIDNNKITDGLSYGIFIQTPAPFALSKNKFLAQLLSKQKLKANVNSGITISNNYLAQNRYGLAGETVQNLIVQGNTFIQRFTDTASRQQWTNNDVLLASATNITWTDNLYKEAFTQDNDGDNTSALDFVPFPAHGGVSLP